MELASKGCGWGAKGRAQVVAGGHALELDLGADGVAAAVYERHTISGGGKGGGAVGCKDARGSWERADVHLALAAGVVPAGAGSAAAADDVNVAAVVGLALESAGGLAVRVLCVGRASGGVVEVAECCLVQGEGRAKRKREYSGDGSDEKNAGHSNFKMSR